MDLKADITELFDLFGDILTVCNTFVLVFSCRDMGLDADTVNLDVFLSHAFDHRYYFVCLVTKEHIVVVVEEEYIWVSFLSKLKRFLNVVRNVVLPHI